MKKIVFILFLIPFVAHADVLREVRDGLDYYEVPEEPVAGGELAADVYSTGKPAQGLNIYIPTTNYVRMGGGVNLDNGFGEDYASSIGFGWNFSSYVRGEFNFQVQDKRDSLGADLYFDLVRRFVRAGDLTRQRTFIPFIGLGVAGGESYITPRGTAGLGIRMGNLTLIDIAYQYMRIKNVNFNNIMATLRFDF